MFWHQKGHSLQSNAKKYTKEGNISSFFLSFPFLSVTSFPLIVGQFATYFSPKKGHSQQSNAKKYTKEGNISSFFLSFFSFTFLEITRSQSL
jgi:hypothetical protein